MTLMKEKAADLSGKERDFYLIRHLVTNGNDALVFDSSTEDGKRRWEIFPSSARDNLRIIVWKILQYIQTAKN